MHVRYFINSGSYFLFYFSYICFMKSTSELDSRRSAGREVEFFQRKGAVFSYFQCLQSLLLFHYPEEGSWHISWKDTRPWEILSSLFQDGGGSDHKLEPSTLCLRAFWLEVGNSAFGTSPNLGSSSPIGNLDGHIWVSQRWQMPVPLFSNGHWQDGGRMMEGCRLWALKSDHLGLIPGSAA